MSDMDFNLTPAGFGDAYDEEDARLYGFHIPASGIKVSIDGDEGLFIIDLDNRVFCASGMGTTHRKNLITKETVSDGQIYYCVLFQVLHPAMLPSWLTDMYDTGYLMEDEDEYSTTTI